MARPTGTFVAVLQQKEQELHAMFEARIQELESRCSDKVGNRAGVRTVALSSDGCRKNVVECILTAVTALLWFGPLLASGSGECEVEEGHSTASTRLSVQLRCTRWVRGEPFSIFFFQNVRCLTSL